MWPEPVVHVFSIYSKIEHDRGPAEELTYPVDSVDSSIDGNCVARQNLSSIEVDDPALHRDLDLATSKGRIDEAVLEQRGVCREVDQNVTLDELGEVGVGPLGDVLEGAVVGREDGDAGG